MALDPRTRDHLNRAERNREVARGLCTPAVISVIKPAPLEWAAVAGFYAGVHYVNAYLWERVRLEPANHPERNRWIRATPQLRSIFGAYKALSDLGWDARYKARFQVRAPVIQHAVHQQLDRIRAQVMRELGMTP